MNEQKDEIKLTTDDLDEGLSSDLTNFIMQHYRRILILERNPTIAKAIETLMQGEGYNVTVVTDKTEVLKLAKNNTPDILLVTEGVSADSLLIRDELAEEGIKVDFRVLKDFGSAILGAQQGAKYSTLKDSFMKSLGLLMSVLEFPDTYLYNHSAKIADYTEKITRHLDLDPDSADQIVYAAYFHGLPQLVSRFIENAERLPIDTILKNTSTLTLGQFLTIVPDSKVIVNILEHLKERYDGKGYPDRLKGEDIPLGARIIMLVDVYMHLIQGGPGRKSIKRINAIEQLQKNAGTAFDPKLVDILTTILRKELAEDQIAEGREEILLLDAVSDDDLLVLKLRNEGYKVIPMDDSAAVMKKVKDAPPDLIISEVALPQLDGFQILKALKDNRDTRAIPVLFVSQHGDPSYITKGLRLGAEDYIKKPYNMEILFLKIVKLLARAALDRGVITTERRGVSGSLLEMGMLDIIQILAAGTKTAMIRIKRADEEGVIYMQDGQIVNVSLGDLEGEDAFYSMISWRDGDFVIHPDMTTQEKNIFTTNDMLLLRGLQKLDESRRHLNSR